MVFDRIREWIYAKQVDRRFPKRRKRLVWRSPRPIYSQTPEGGRIAHSYVFPTISKRKIRYLGRREVYPHATHVHVTKIHEIEDP